MAVGTEHPPVLLAIPGVRIATAAAGIKHATRDDLTLFALAEGARVAAVFTQNAFCAAPVTVARAHLAHQPRWLLINSGNANAGTGTRGLADARATCQTLADCLAARPEQVLPFSTGVIGEYLPVDKIRAQLPALVAGLDEAHWPNAMRAIMTTDTRPKGASRQIDVDGQILTVTGIAKGSGMIHPNMATLLSYLATDARVETALLQSILTAAMPGSFNSITVDGDTSTNDACVLMASGASGVDIIPNTPSATRFSEAVHAICAELAEAIVRDGEGATKLLRVSVERAASDVEAHRVANTVALSPLIKTALFASDPNWGRILAAVGRAGCDGLDIARVRVWLDGVCIVEHGARAADYTEAAGQAVMRQDEITVRIDLDRGTFCRQVLTCDFSYDYVRINAEYRT